MANEIQWEPRVPQQKILRLYQTDAQGIHDEARINDVGNEQLKKHSIKKSSVFLFLYIH